MIGYPRSLRRSLVSFCALGIVAGCCGEKFNPERDTLSLGIPGGWSFVVMGDSRPVAWDSWCVSRKMVTMIAHLRPGPELLFDCGDLINSPGSRIQWFLFGIQFSPLPKTFRFYPIIGNHDVKDEESEGIYREKFDLPGEEIYYSLDRNESHFVVLDTEVPGHVNDIRGGQLSWLRNDLGGASPTRPTFIFMHRPLFPVAGYAREPLKNREELHRLFVSQGVKAVFAGHEHLYSRSELDGVIYIITGGGGARLIKGTPGSWHHFVVVSLKDSEILIQVVDKDGKVRDAIRR